MQEVTEAFTANGRQTYSPTDEENRFPKRRPRSAIRDRARYTRSLICAHAVLFGALLVGCCELYDEPDQSQFVPLVELADRREAVVRVYGAPIPIVGRFAIHTWLVTKRAHEQSFHRWELWLCPEGDYGYICKDSKEPTSHVGIGGTFIIGEKMGDEAESIVAFVENESPQYPYRMTYVPLPGPNSNSYTQWVLDNSGWDLNLQSCAAGATWIPLLGWPTSSVDEN